MEHLARQIGSISPKRLVQLKFNIGGYLSKPEKENTHKAYFKDATDWNDYCVVETNRSILRFSLSREVTKSFEAFLEARDKDFGDSDYEKILRKAFVEAAERRYIQAVKALTNFDNSR